MKYFFSFIFAVTLTFNIFSADLKEAKEEFSKKKDAISFGFLGGYQGSVVGKSETWANGGFWGIQAEYLTSLPKNQVISIGLDFKQTSIVTSTLSDLGVKIMYGLVFWDAYKIGLGTRFDINLKSMGDALFGKYNLVPYIQNAYVLPMNDFSALEFYVNIGMPIQLNIKDQKINGAKLRGIETSLGINWMFAVNKKR